ncbi:MAG TPA: dienelactone hydrolase family protein [Acidimicrobiia bacterium]|nr:dienelactone hydrolase family protein [Acidimicrobiia bacterium]
MIELAEGDGAFMASPESDPQGGVLLLHAWWGLNQPIQDLADRLADDGFTVIAPDLFDGVVLDTVEDADAHGENEEAMEETYFGKANHGLDALLAALRAPSVGVVAFSFGAWYARRLAKVREEVEALVIFYGGDGFALPERAGGGHPTFLAHVAEDDPYEEEDPSGVEPFHTRLQELDPRNGAYLYPGAKHWFFESDRPEFDPEASRLAYSRTIEFLRECLPQG